MYIARDKEGNLMFWDCSEKPKRVCDCTWACENHRGVGYIDSSLFPYLKWEDEPLEVHLFSNDMIDDVKAESYQEGHEIGYDSGYDACLDNEF